MIFNDLANATWVYLSAADLKPVITIDTLLSITSEWAATILMYDYVHV